MYVLIPADLGVPAAKAEVGLQMALAYPHTREFDENRRVHLPPLSMENYRHNVRASSLASNIQGEAVVFVGDVIFDLPDEEGHRAIAADLLNRTNSERRATVRGMLEAMHRQALDYLSADYPDREEAAWKIVWKDLGDLLEEMHEPHDHESQIIAIIDLG